MSEVPGSESSDNLGFESSWAPPVPPEPAHPRRPLWRRPWVLVFAGVLLLALVTGVVSFSFSFNTTTSHDVHGDASGSPNTNPAPVGYQTVVSARGGYSLAVPKSWVVLDLSTDTLAGYAKRLATTHPRLAAFFSDSIWSHDAGLPYTDLFAADPSGSTPNPLNVRAEHFAQPGNPIDHVADIRSTLRAEGMTEIDVRQARVTGRDAVIGTAVDLDSVRSIRYLITNLLVECRPGVQCILVFQVPDSPRNADTVDEIIRTLSIG